jgi:hypothetical protein
MTLGGYLLLLGIAVVGCLIASLVTGNNMFNTDTRENALLGGTPEARRVKHNAFVVARNEGYSKVESREIARVAYEKALPSS